MANKPIQIIGIKEDLKRLNKLAPDLRRDITKSYRAFMAPVIADAKSNLPAGIGQTQMRGFGRKWKLILPWDKAVGNRATRGITVKIDTRKARKKNLDKGIQYETVGAFVIQQKSPAGIVFDIAGRGGNPSPTQTRNGNTYAWNNTLIENLAKTFPKNPSRTMYPAVEKNSDNIESAIKNITEQVERQLSVALSRSNL